MQATTFVIAAALAMLPPARTASLPAGPGAALTNPRIDHCLVTVKDEVQVPAQEAGVLVRLEAEEGAQVRRGELLGNIDDSERQMQKRLALIEQQAAAERAENDVNVRYAEAAARVAESEYQQAIEANRKVRGAFPEAEVRRLKLAWHRAELQIEQAQLDQRMAVFTSQSRAAEVEATETNIARRQLIAPVDGQIVSLHKHAGEWCNPGDGVLRIVRFDKLRVEGFLSSTEYDPTEVAGKNVAVEIELARGRKVSFPGKIVYVSPLIGAGGEYRLWAEVANRQEQGEWLLRPGHKASMTIHLR